MDLKPLNEKSVLQEVHPLPKVDETLTQLNRAKVFTKLDANSGFWQIPLTQSSHLLTTVITPAGWYSFNKLPFRILSAPEHFQKQMSHVLQGMDGVLCQTGDVLVFGKDQAERNTRVAAVPRIGTAEVSVEPEDVRWISEVLLLKKFLS